MAAVLCIDDSDVALRIRKMLIESIGHTVITATSGEQAISLFQLAQFDLVLCDYFLPGRTGAEIAQQMRVIKPGIPFLLISGSIELPGELPAVDAMFTKGDSPERLLGLVSGLLKGGVISESQGFASAAIA